jgi:hypothetical protein
MSDTVLLTAEIDETSSALEPTQALPASEPVSPEPDAAAAEPVAVLSPDHRSTLLAAVQNSGDLPPGVRERLTKLVEQSSTLDAQGEPLLATRGVLDLLAQGLPAVLRRETPAPVSRPEHPAGDAFFAVSGEDLSDQQAEQIARTQLQRAGLLRSA